MVRLYLQTRFQLDTRNLGIVPMRNSPPNGVGRATWDETCLVVLRTSWANAPKQGAASRHAASVQDTHPTDQNPSFRTPESRKATDLSALLRLETGA
jgi:hypothetical protein